jgi:hypothetical protein
MRLAWGAERLELPQDYYTLTRHAERHAPLQATSETCALQKGVGAIDKNYHTAC